MMKIARYGALPAMLAALGAAGGCYTGDLTMDIHVVRDMESLAYGLTPGGHLTLKEGGGLVEGRADRPIYATRLDQPAMRQLKKVIHKSGFLVESQPLTGTLTAPTFLRIDVKLGLWANKMDIRGRKVESVGKIIAELDKHLPEKHRIRYHAAAAQREEEDYLKHTR